MTTATPSNNTKTIRRPRCKHCSKQFRTSSIKALYCSRICKEKSAAIKKRVTYTARASNSAFMYLLASECERAGTLQILEGHDVASLITLYEVYKHYLRANEYGSTKVYALSHISPVCGSTSVGKLHASNIVVALSAMNRSHGVKHFGHGLSIPRASLDSRYMVNKGDSRKATIERIVKFLGEDVITEFAKAVNLQPTTRHKVMSWLVDNLDLNNPAHRIHFDKLDTMSTKSLTNLKAELQGKDTSGYKLPVSETQALFVCAQELVRHSEIRPDLMPLAEFIMQAAKRVNPMEPFLLESDLLQLLFDILHGKELSDVAQDLAPVLRHLKTLGKITLDVPVFETPVARVPVVVLKTFKDFAQELDGVQPDYIPTLLPGHTATYEGEPLPWD